MKNQKGFTLIEIIMVIVILGILSAVMVPKFMDFTTDAHKANIQAFVASVKTSLEMNASKKIIDIGEKRYPKGNTVTDLTAFFDKPPKDWSTDDVNAENVDLVYSGDGSNFPNGILIRYNSAGGSNYSLTLITAAYGWDANFEF